VIELASAGETRRVVPVSLADDSIIIAGAPVSGPRLVVATAAIESAGGSVVVTADQVAISFASVAVSR
jgi:hypothetical protein